MGILDGKVALVTGASRGIGAAIAERLAAEGAAVGVTARSRAPHPKLPGTLRETVDTIEKRGGRAFAIQGDLLEAEDRTRAVTETREQLGPIDILVNNAAASFYIPSEKISEKRFHVAFEINARAPWDLSQQVIPDMRAAGRGWILNISSVTSVWPAGPPYDAFAMEGGSTLYGSTKAFLERMTAGMAAEFYSASIAVNSLAPVAAVLTPGALAIGVIPDAYQASAEPVECMAESALALCEPVDPMITGRILYSKPFLEELGREVRTLDGAAAHAP